MKKIVLVLLPIWLLFIGQLYSPASFAANAQHVAKLKQKKKCVRCDLKGARLKGMILSRAILSKSNLSNAVLDGLNMRGANFNGNFSRCKNESS